MRACTRVFGVLFAMSLAAGVSATDLRDPTRPPAPVVPVKHSTAHVLLPRVSAIFVSSARRVAIFDDQPVREGDVVGGCLIEAITATGVRYRHAGLVAFAPLDNSTEATPSP
jgi:hypothetical protein